MSRYKQQGCSTGLPAFVCGMKIPVNFTLSINAETADSDETLRIKARNQVDQVLRTIGEAAGEFVWNQIERNIGRVKGSKPAHLWDSGERAVKKASPLERSDLEEELFRILKIQRGQFEAARQ
jgi:hypothetical protein